MGNCFLHGNAGGESGGLILQFIGSMTAPSNPKENMIWVKTDRAITQFLITRSVGAWTQIAGAVEMVYEASDDYTMTGISTLFFNGKLHGTYGQAWFKPTGLYQSDGAKANPKDAYIYKSGTWVQFSSEKYVVFEAGKGLSAGLTGFSNATCNSNTIVGKNPLYAGPGNGDAIISREKIDVTQYKTATFSGINCGFNGNGNANSSSISAFVGGASTTIASAITSGGATLASNKTVTVDISNVTGSVEFGFRTYSSATYAVSFKNFNLNGIVFS